MSLFKCSRCGCVDNTALGAYWHRPKDPLCAECATGAWHGEFPKETAVAPKWMLGNDGFLYERGGWKPSSAQIVGDP